MTMVVGMHLGSYVLIAADTRMTYYPSASTRSWRDGKGKVHTTKLGLISGAGFAPLLDAVRQRLATGEGEGIRCLDDIKRITAEEASRHRPPLEWPDDAKRAHEKSAWLMTWLNPTRLGGDHLRLGLLPAFTDPHVYSIEKGDVALLAPLELSPDDIEKARENLKRDMVTPDTPEGFVASVEENVALVASAIRWGASVSDGVGEDFQVGVHTERSQTGVSEIVTATETGFSGVSLSLEAPSFDLMAAVRLPEIRKMLEDDGYVFEETTPPSKAGAGSADGGLGGDLDGQ